MGKQWKQWQTLFFWAPKSLQMLIADGDEIKRCLVLGSYGEPRQHIKKQKHYFVNKGLSNQCSGFSSGHVWMWELDYKESRAPKNFVFELWCWRRLLRVPWTARRSNQSILKEISPACSLEGLMLKLKLQYFGHLMQRTDSFERPWCWEILKAGEGDDRGWDGWMGSPMCWTWVWISSRSWWWSGKPGVLVHGVKKSQTRVSNWTEEFIIFLIFIFVI